MIPAEKTGYLPAIPPPMTPPRGPALGRWLAALTVALIVSALSLRTYLPPLPSPLELDLALAPGEGERSEPLITSGRREAGDFLFVRQLADGRIAFGYEAWGKPSQLSAPLTRPADSRWRLRVEMPALTNIRGVFATDSPRLRLSVNGVTVFDEPQVDCHERWPREIRFAENPIGGTACGATLHGQLTLPDGRELRGWPAPLLGWRERAHGWLFVSRWPAVGTLALASLTFWAWPRRGRLTLGSRTWAAWSQTARGALGSHRHFAAVGTVALIAFLWLVSYGTFDVIAPEAFGEFYDFQALSLLHGRLDVPREAIGGEAFVVDGKFYGYFGLTPALLRLPLVIFNLGFGELTRAFMIVYFAVTLLTAYLLLRAARRLLGLGESPPPAWATWSFIGSIGLGSSVFFLGSRAYVYHEAILCGVMFAVCAAWAALQHLLDPARRWWLGSLAAGILSVHARPPTGLFALTFLAAIGTLLALEKKSARDPAPRRRASLLILACVAGVFSFNLVSYLKFRTFEGCPLRLNVQYDAARLARIEGKQFHLVNLPFMVDHYLVRPNFRLERRFPYLFVIPELRDDEWTGAKLDYFDPTLAMPYAMPALFGVAVLGGVGAFAVFPTRRRVLTAVAIAGLPMTLAMFTAIAITQRYTADFCPLLLTAAAFGTTAAETAGGRLTRIARTGIVAATIASVLITATITLHYQGSIVWGVPETVRTRYVEWCRGVDAWTAAVTVRP